MTIFKTIHPENRSELAQADLDSLQKDIVMYLNDLSDEHIITLTNHFASNQTSLGKGKKWKQPNLLRDWIESTRSWKLHEEDLNMEAKIRKNNEKRYKKTQKLREKWDKI